MSDVPDAVTLLDRVRARKLLPTPDVARAIRRAAGVSQREVAAELHVHELTVRRWEQGVFKPRGEARAAYAQLLVELQEASR